MFISVIIPVHNRPAPVVRAVASVLGQTWSELECVVVDDGSTDATPDVLRAIRDPRLRVLRQDNLGVASARNAGIATARGDMLALLDSDDHYLPNKLEVQARFMLERGLEISHTDEIWMRGGRRVNPRAHHAKPGGRIFARAVDDCLVAPSCAMFTRRFWTACGPFDETLPACEDYDLWLRAALTFEIGLVPQTLTVREGGRPDQLSRRIIGLDLYRITALAKILARPDLSPQDRAAAASALRAKARIYMRGCQLHGRPEEAARVAEMAARAIGSVPTDQG